MIPNYLSEAWSSLAPALGNHLWQSTVFVITAGLLTLILRKNHARVRYWLWLAASVKFLIPFSLLVALGSYLSGAHTAAGTNAAFYIAVEEVSQPFTQPTMPVIPQVAASTALTQLLPALLAVVWLCGFLIVIFHWYFRWRRISAAIRKSVPLQEGREVQALRRLERTGGMRKPTEMLLSRTSLEPGVFGITRPVLLWPEGISERLEDAHLEAIFAHELWHLRRRDNLAAAIHMVVEAIFWFHPLVWWLGARLLEERERACDEEVLESGSDRQAYAESILKICEFCVGSPLACVSGVTGADLKKRMAYIMTKNLSRKLDFSRKLLLSIAGLLAVAAPIALGLLHAAQTRAESQAQITTPTVPSFATALIKPNNGEPMAGFTIVGKPFKAIMWQGDRLMATNFTLHGLIQVAYGIPDDQIVGGPDWLNTEGYDLDAKMGKSVVDEMQKRGRLYGVSGRTLMFQKLLSERFKLSFHRETKELPVYALVVTNGPKFQPAKAGDTYPDGIKNPDGSPMGANIASAEEGKLVGQGIPVARLVEELSSSYYLHRTVLDKTGLTDKYDFTLQWTPEENQAAILAAVQEQLGLKLEPQTAPVEVLVIDHAEKPADPQAQNIGAITPAYKDVSIKSDESVTAALKTGKGIIMQRMMIKPGEFTSSGNTLQEVIRLAYGVQDYQISGAPAWLNSEIYNVEAKAEKSVIDELQKLGSDQRELENRRMIQTLLEDRLHFKVHHETREMPIYSLVVANAGKLHEAQGNCPPNSGPVLIPMPKEGKLITLPLTCGVFARSYPRPGHLSGQKVSLTQLTAELSQLTGRMVLDKVSLAGKYDINLDWTPEPGQSWTSPAAPNPSLSTAIQEQLGLKLESQTGPVPLLVIDHVEAPSGN